MATIVMLVKRKVPPGVPLCTGRLSEHFDGKNNESVMAVEDNLKKEHCRTKVNFKKMRNLPKKDKVLLRRIKNIEASKMSREKAKHREKFLEQRLSDLQYEKMKLLLEKEALTKQNMELQKENSNLKSEVFSRSFLPMNEEKSSRSAFRQAEGVGDLKDFHHSANISMEGTESELSRTVSSFCQQTEKETQNHQILGPVSVPSKTIIDATDELLSNFSLIEWVNDPENNDISDKVFPLLEYGFFSPDKKREDFQESSLKDQNLECEHEYCKELDECFINYAKEDCSGPKLNLKDKNDYQESIKTFPNIGNDVNAFSKNAEIDQTFVELPSQWTFDNLYEDI